MYIAKIIKVCTWSDDFVENDEKNTSYMFDSLLVSGLAFSHKSEVPMKNILFIVSALFSCSSFAALQKMNVEYKSADGAVLEGFVAYDDSKKSPQPVVLIVHDWMGLADFQKNKAQEIAKMGYVAFAVDIYGKGVRPKDQNEAAQFAGKYRNGDRSLLRSRIKAAYDHVATLKAANTQKIVAMGYCFGGTTVLELARSGVNLAGTVSFHGNLATPRLEDAKNIKGPVLVMHGNDDPFVKADEVATFKKEMSDAKVNMTFVGYNGAVHSFTIPDAGNDNSKGAAYNADADKKSWKEFTSFLKKVTR